MHAQHQLGTRHMVAVGIETRRNSSSGRLSRTTMSASPRIIACNSSAPMLGVPHSCSTYSPNALLGTCTPENSS